MALPRRSVHSLRARLDDLVESNELDQAFVLLQRLDDDGYEWWIELQQQASRIPSPAWAPHPQLLIRRIVPLCWADRGEEASNLIAILERSAGQPGGLPVEKVKALRCVVLHTLGRYGEAALGLEPLLASASAEVRANAHNMMASCLCYMGGSIDEIEMHWRRCAEDALEAGQIKTRSAALFNLIWYVYIPQGRIADSEAAVEALRQISNAKDKISQAWFRIPRALIAFDLGEANARRQLLAALGWAKRLDNPEAVETLTCMLADWHLRRGEHDKAAERILSLRLAAHRPASRIYVEAVKEATVPEPSKESFSGLLKREAIPLYRLRAYIIAIRLAAAQGWTQERVQWLKEAGDLAGGHGFVGFGKALELLGLTDDLVRAEEWLQRTRSERLGQCVAAAFPIESGKVLQEMLVKNKEPDVCRFLLCQIGCPVIRVQTFGELKVWLSGNLLTQKMWQRNSAKLLFILLLLRDRNSIDAPSAAEILWPDSDGDFAQASLKVAETTLRKILEPNQPARKRNRFLWRENDVIQLNLGAWAQLDFKEARKIVVAGDGEQAIEWAPRLCGPFLQELCNEDWVAPYIELYTDIRRQLWRMALDRAHRNGQPDLARQLTLLFRSTEPDNAEWRQAL